MGVCTKTCTEHTACVHEYGSFWCPTGELPSPGIMRHKSQCQLACAARHPRHRLVFPSLAAVGGRVEVRGMNSATALNFPSLRSIGPTAAPTPGGGVSATTTTAASGAATSGAGEGAGEAEPASSWLSVTDNRNLKSVRLPKLARVAGVPLAAASALQHAPPSVAPAAAPSVCETGGPHCRGEDAWTPSLDRSGNTYWTHGATLATTFTDPFVHGKRAAGGYYHEGACVTAVACVAAGGVPLAAAADQTFGAACATEKGRRREGAHVYVRLNPALELLGVGGPPSRASACTTAAGTTAPALPTVVAGLGLPTRPAGGQSTSFNVDVSADAGDLRFRMDGTWSVLFAPENVYYDEHLDCTPKHASRVTDVNGDPLEPFVTPTTDPENYVLDLSSIKTKQGLKPYFRGNELKDSTPRSWRMDYHKGGVDNPVYTTVMAGIAIPIAPSTYMLRVDLGTRREPFNSTPMAVNSISSGSPHVRCTPMWALSTCGVHGEIKKNTHPKNITALFRDQACTGRSRATPPTGSSRSAPWAVQFHPHRGQADFVWLPVRTPQGGALYVWCLAARRNQEKYPRATFYRPCSRAGFQHAHCAGGGRLRVVHAGARRGREGRLADGRRHTLDHGHEHLHQDNDGNGRGRGCRRRHGSLSNDQTRGSFVGDTAKPADDHTAAWGGRRHVARCRRVRRAGRVRGRAGERLQGCTARRNPRLRECERRDGGGGRDDCGHGCGREVCCRACAGVRPVTGTCMRLVCALLEELPAPPTPPTPPTLRPDCFCIHNT